MNVLEHLFNRDLNISSPVQVDYDRKVSYDEEGNEYVSWVEVDYPKIQRSLGSVDDWSLNALLKAGINPNFSIHTGYGTRLEGINDMNSISADVDIYLANEQNNNITDKE